jgi:hypothetical protein
MEASEFGILLLAGKGANIPSLYIPDEKRPMLGSPKKGPDGKAIAPKQIRSFGWPCHWAWGLGVYNVFRNKSVVLTRAFGAPKNP